jgi:hypothetical protein
LKDHIFQFIFESPINTQTLQNKWNKNVESITVLIVKKLKKSFWVEDLNNFWIKHSRNFCVRYSKKILRQWFKQVFASKIKNNLRGRFKNHLRQIFQKKPFASTHLLPNLSFPRRTDYYAFLKSQIASSKRDYLRIKTYSILDHITDPNY